MKQKDMKEIPCGSQREGYELYDLKKSREEFNRLVRLGNRERRSEEKK